VNPKKLYTILGILAFCFLCGGGYADVKSKANNNEKNHIELKKETNQNIKEIRQDQTKMLVQQTGLKKDISYLISMIEDLKKSD